MSVEPSQIAALMRTKFAHERDTLHRLIEAQLGDYAEPTSAVLSRGASALELDPALNLGQRSATPALHSVRPTAGSKRRKLRSRLLAGMALLALTGALVFGFADDPPKPPPGPGERRLQGSPSTGEPSLLQGTGSTLGPGASDAGHAALHAPRPTRAQAEPLERGNTSALPLSSIDQGAQHTPGKRVEKRGVDAAVEAAPRVVPRAAPPPLGEARGSERKQDLDLDLRSVPRGERRALDLENPFR
jgi:hypothetical protein